MNFEFTPEQYMFQESVRGFLDQNWRLRSRMAGEESFDRELWKGLTGLGITSMLVPEAYGGLGLSYIDLALTLEELGRALAATPAVDTIVAADVLDRFGTPDQKSMLLPSLASGDLVIVLALAEADAGYDPHNIAVTARAAPGGCELNGRKSLVHQARAADELLVAARFEESGSLGLVLCDARAPGVNMRRHETLDLVSRYYEVEFDAVRIDASAIVGAKALPAAVDRLFDSCAAAAAAQMTGIAARVLELTVAYVRQRVQFGKPIGAQQAIKHRCADMLAAVETSRTAAYHAAWSLAHDSPDAAKAVSMAKAFAGDASRFVCNEGLQLHGGIGFTWELDVHLFLRRAKVLEYLFGDAAFHRERVLSAALREIEVT